jgi:alkylation response protein AidB-like acyl-CoA dehydrogenase
VYYEPVAVGAASGSLLSDLPPDVGPLLELVRDFATREVFPGVLDRDREERFPRDLVRRAGELGLLGGVVPVEYGGAGLSHLAYSAIVEEMSRIDNILAVSMTFPSGLAGAGLLRYGTEEQKQRYLPDLCAGETMAAAAVTEPSSGTDVSDMHTVCRRDGDDYVLDGQKTWISFLDVCDWLVTFATLDRGTRYAKVCAFIVPRDAKGLSLRPFKNKLGFRALATGEVFLEGVRVPAENRLGKEGEGFKVAMAAVENGRLGVASRAVGIAQDCLDRSLAYAREREVFGQPIGKFQLVQSMITDMVVGIESSRYFTRRLAALKDAGARARRDASLAKMHASDVAMMAATNAVQIHGAYGTHEDYYVGKHFRDAKVFQIVEGQNQLHRAMVAEYALGYRGGRETPEA